MSYFENKEAVVEFVKNTLLSSKAGSPLIMTIGRDKSGDYYAHTVIYESSESIEETPSKPSTTTSLPTTPDG